MQVLILILLCAGLVWIIVAFLLRKRNGNRNFLNRNSGAGDPIYYSTMESVDGTNHSASSMEFGGGSFGGGGSGGDWGDADSGSSGGDSGGDGGGGGD